MVQRRGGALTACRRRQGAAARRMDRRAGRARMDGRAQSGRRRRPAAFHALAAHGRGATCPRGDRRRPGLAHAAAGHRRCGRAGCGRKRPRGARRGAAREQRVPLDRERGGSTSTRSPTGCWPIATCCRRPSTRPGSTTKFLQAQLAGAAARPVPRPCSRVSRAVAAAGPDVRTSATPRVVATRAPAAAAFRRLVQLGRSDGAARSRDPARGLRPAGAARRRAMRCSARSTRFAPIHGSALRPAAPAPSRC